MMLLITILIILSLITAFILWCLFKGKGNDTILCKCPNCNSEAFAVYKCGTQKTSVYYAVCPHCTSKDYIVVSE